MERDKKLVELFREHGLKSAPEGFTSEVMKKIEDAPIRAYYKPIISRVAIYSCAAIFMLLIILYYQFGPKDAHDPLFSLPSLEINFPNLSPLITTGLAAGLLALFILVLSESGLRKRKG